MKRIVLITCLALAGPFGGVALAAGSHAPAQHRLPAAASFAPATHVARGVFGQLGRPSIRATNKLSGAPTARPGKLRSGGFHTDLNDLNWAFQGWQYAGGQYWWAVYLDGPNDGAYDKGYVLFSYNGVQLTRYAYCYIYYGSFGIWGGPYNSIV